MDKVRALILTGVSGSGKSTAAKALEDIGYFCIDNLPVQLLETVLLLADQNELVQRVAVVMDVRERRFAGSHRDALRQLRAAGIALDILFLDAADEVLIRRFNETRRSHPLAEGDLSIEDALAAERAWLADLRDEATTVLDTSAMNVHELKRRVQRFAASTGASRARLRLALYSFGFKYGLPSEAHYVFDVRFIPNPYFDEQLRPMSGLDQPVIEFIEGREEAGQLVARLESLLAFLVPLNEREGKARLGIAFGCTGGRHRSVYFAERTAAILRAQGHDVSVFHRDVHREKAGTGELHGGRREG